MCVLGLVRFRTSQTQKLTQKVIPCTALHCITLYLIEVYEVQGPALHHGLLRVHHGEQKGVEALVLVQTSCANGLERGERVGDYSHSQVGLEEGREQCS